MVWARPSRNRMTTMSSTQTGGAATLECGAGW